MGVLETKLPPMAGPGPEALCDDGKWLWLELPEEKPPKDTLLFSLYTLAYFSIIRCTYRMVTPQTALVRVYYLPVDVGRRLLPNRYKDKSIKRHARKVMESLDVSEQRWRGKIGAMRGQPLFDFDLERTSLFYRFNTLASPRPSPDSPEHNVNTADLLTTVLSSPRIPGMITEPFEYQRRSIAMMIQREISPSKYVDSRLKVMHAPSGEVYYFDQETCEVFEKPVYYDGVCGGILAEEMGTG